MNDILNFLLQNQGHPIYAEDIYDVFNVKSPQDRIKVDNELNTLIKKGLIYPYNNGFYLTRYGQAKIQSPLQVTPAANPYTIARQRQKGITYNNRDQYIKVWANHFIESLNQFKKNHPELSNLLNSIASEAHKDLGIGSIHDPTEFAKDVQAVFNRFDFSIPELRYAPVETSYNTPEILNSIEHAISEVIQRLGKYSSRHKSYITDSKKYREVYDKVEEALNDINIPNIFVKELDLKEGSFVQRKTIEDNLTSYIGKTYKIGDTSLIKISLNHLDTKINGILKSISPYTFFEGEGNEEIVNKLYELIKTKEGNILFNNFIESCPVNILLQVSQSLFANKEYKGVNFTGIPFPESSTITNCDFQGANFTNTSWNNVTVENNNFQGASFLNANLINVNTFKNNNINQADFDGAKISVEVDKEVNIGEPINYVSLKLTKEEMKEKGFGENESFDHTGLHGSTQVPGRDADVKGERWVRYIQASPTAPFPKELYDLFNLHKVSVPRFLGWIGGTYNKTNKTLYVTKVRSDLLQKSFQLSKYFLDEAEKKGIEEFHGNISTTQLRNFSQYKATLERYFKGWQHVFMNQAVREAKNYHAKYVAVPIDSLSPQRNYDRLVNDIIKGPGGNQEEIPIYPYEIKGNWYIIPVDQITKFAKIEKLSWQEIHNLEGWVCRILSPAYKDFFVKVFKKAQIGDYQTSRPFKHIEYTFHSSNDNWRFNQEELQPIQQISINKHVSSKLSWQDPREGEYRKIYKWLDFQVKMILKSKADVLYEMQTKFEIDDITAEDIYNNWIRDYIRVDSSQKLSWISSNLNFSKYSEEKPSEDQIEAGNYKKEHIRKDGLDITIENKKGSTRSGTDRNGKEWSIKMKNDYGYIKGTVGKDKDHVDVFLSNDYKEGMPVFIVNQLNDKGTFDEHKCIMGTDNKEDAEKIYLDNYEKGWGKYEKDLVDMTIDDFKEWVKDKKETKKPAEEIEQESSLKLSWQDPSILQYKGWLVREEIHMNNPKYGVISDVFIDYNGNVRFYAFWGDSEKEAINHRDKVTALKYYYVELPNDNSLILKFIKLLRFIGVNKQSSLSWEYEEPQEEEQPQEENLVPSLKFDMSYKKEKENMINRYLDDLIKAKKENDLKKVEQIKQKIDEIVSLGSKYSWKTFQFQVVRDRQGPGGGLQGYVTITYNELVNILGEPPILGSDDSKTQAEWILYFPEINEYAWIYDYKETVSKESVTDWHIGGKDKNVVDLIRNVLGLDKDIREFKLAWQNPPIADKSKAEELLKKLNEETINTWIQEELNYINVIPLSVDDVIKIKSKLKPSEIDYEGLGFTYFFFCTRETMFGEVHDLIGMNDDKGGYENIATGLGESLNELLKESSKKLSWNSGKDSYKDILYNYDPERGQQIDEYESGKGEGTALSPLVMKQPWNTENLTWENDKDKKQNDDKAFDWTGRENLQLWV